MQILAVVFISVLVTLTILLFFSFLYYKNRPSKRMSRSHSELINQNPQTSHITDVCDAKAFFVQPNTSNSGLKPLEFTRVKTRNVDRFLKRNNLSKITDTVIPFGVTGSSMTLATGLFESTGTLNEHLLYHDGTISSIIAKSGKIVEHAGFKAISPSKIFAPLIAFQVMSFFVGRYYLHRIDGQLAYIRSAVERIERRMHYEKMAILKTAFEALESLYTKKSFSTEDINVINTVIHDARIVRNEYTALLSECEERDLDALKCLLTPNTVAEYDKLPDPTILCEAIIHSRRAEILAHVMRAHIEASLSEKCSDRASNISWGLQNMKSSISEYKDDIYHLFGEQSVLHQHLTFFEKVEASATRESSRVLARDRRDGLAQEIERLLLDADDSYSTFRDINSNLFNIYNSESRLLVRLENHGLSLYSNISLASE